MGPERASPAVCGSVSNTSSEGGAQRAVIEAGEDVRLVLQSAAAGR